MNRIVIEKANEQKINRMQKKEYSYLLQVKMRTKKEGEKETKKRKKVIYKI